MKRVAGHSAMIANVVLLCGVVAVATAEPFLFRVSTGQGKFVTSKSKLRFYIPHGQCSAHLALTHVCRLSAMPEAFRVKVKDDLGFPEVVIDKKHKDIYIFRNFNESSCYGIAYMSLKYNCFNEDAYTNKTRSPLPPVPQNTDIQNYVRRKRDTSLPYYKLPDIMTKQIYEVNRDLQDISVDANPFANNDLVQTGLLADYALNNVISLEKKLTDESLQINKVLGTKTLDNLSLANDDVLKLKTNVSLFVSDPVLLKFSSDNNATKIQDNSSLPNSDQLDLRIMDNPLVTQSDTELTQNISLNPITGTNENVTTSSYNSSNSSIVNNSSVPDLPKKENSSLSDSLNVGLASNTSTVSNNSTNLDNDNILSNLNVNNNIDLQNQNSLNSSVINQTNLSESPPQNVNVSLTTLAFNESSLSSNLTQTAILYNSTEPSVNLSNKTI